MAMNKSVSLAQLSLHSPFRVFRKGRDGVVGLDSESLTTGYAFLVTDSLGRHSWISSSEDVIRFLTCSSYESSFNTFWNMDFDVSVLLKWLGYDFCRDLVKNTSASFGDVKFEYVPKRYLRVGRNVFTDASQYYVPRSLDGAAKTYLNLAKVHVGSKEFCSSDYHRLDLLEYCHNDSVLCRDLTILLLRDLHDMGFSPTTLSSPGTIAEEALVGTVYLPDVTKIPREALEYAWSSYKGGWMECFKRGYFNRLWDYDISSAYPYQISNLVDLTNGEWIHTSKMLRSAFGFVKCVVNITSFVSPIIFQADVNYTPVGSWHTYLTMEEVDFIRCNRLGTVVIEDGWFYVPKVPVKPFVWSMRELFNQRSLVRNKWLPKALSVALYGKFAQRFEDGRTGNLFNPIYAAAVTARTRVQIAGYALTLPQHLCVVSTDGLTFSAPLSSAVLSTRFGGLRLSHSSEGVVVGTNVFTLKGKILGGAWRPGRFDWLRLLKENSSEVVFPLDQFRPTTLAEGVETPSRFEKVGIFETFKYDFNLNFDHKRVFKRVSSSRELLSGIYDSVPWEVSIPKKRKELWELRS